MNRTELTLLITGVILAAIALGWGLHWGYVRIRRASLGGGDNEMAARLHDAEVARDSAYREADAAIQEMRNKLSQTEAELAAAMDGLSNARREAIEARAKLEGRD